MFWWKKHPFVWITAVVYTVSTLTLLFLHRYGTFQPRPVAATLPWLNVQVTWFAMWIAGGVLLGFVVILRLAKRHCTRLEMRGRCEEIGHIVWRGTPYVLLMGLVGARIFHVAVPPPSARAVGINTAADYIGNFYQLLNLRDGGLTIFGALAGGGLALFALTRLFKLNFWAWTDIASIGVVLGQAVGGWGLFFSQSVYGRPTTLPWAVRIDPLYRLPDFAQFETFHPIFLYLSLWHMGLFLLLYWLLHEHHWSLQAGGMTAVYLMGYGLGRFLVEFLRLNSPVVSIGAWSISLTYLASLLCIVGGLVLLCRSAK